MGNHACMQFFYDLILFQVHFYGKLFRQELSMWMGSTVSSSISSFPLEMQTEDNYVKK